MNKNKLSRFLLSTSVGIISTLGISEVSAYSSVVLAGLSEVFAQQSADIARHRADAITHFKQQDPKLSDAEALELANRLVLDPAGLSALNLLSSQDRQLTKKLFEHFGAILRGKLDITNGHYDSFLAKITDIGTLKSLGVDSVRELKSPEAERVVVPAQITKIDDAIYFAEQRRDSGEFEAAAAFYLKARDLTESTNTTKRIELAENALLMYSEHFIHHVARVTSITDANVAAAQTLLASVKALAESTNTFVAYKRAASCAEELGTAIYDQVVAEKAARDKLTDSALITAANTKIAAIYVKLYNADIIARNMHESAAGKLSDHDRNAELVIAADSMRLAIGALADAHAALSTAVFSGDVTVASKLADEAAAFKDMYTELFDGLSTQSNLKKIAANSKILLSKLKATWNARSRFATGTDSNTALNDQYTFISGIISQQLALGDDQYSLLSSGDHYLSADDIVAIRSVEAERLYRVVLDAAAVDPLNENTLSVAVTALQTYVVSGDMPVKEVVTSLDIALKNTLDEVKASAIRKARTEANRVLASAYGLIAKARGLQLEKNESASTSDRINWLDSYLTYARLSNNKASWAAGVKAADVLLGVAAIATPLNDNTKLIKGLALTAKAEALIRDNTTESDDLVAKVNPDNVLTSGLLNDANDVVASIADAVRAQRIQGRDHLRKAFEQAVDLHSSSSVRQGLRLKWADVESAFAVDKITVADTDLTANIQLGNGSFLEQILTQVSADAGNTNVAAVKADLNAWLSGTGSISASGLSNTTIPAGSYITVALADNGVSVRSIGLLTSDLTVGASDLDAGRYVLPGLAAHYAAMAKDPDVKITGETVTLDELDTVEKLYNHFVEKFASIRADSAIYKGYTEAAKAFEKARTAMADWAAAEAAGLSTATYTTWATKRNAAADAYVDAADYEVNRLRALLAAAGRGEYDDAAFDRLSDIATVLNNNSGRLAAAYVTEDVLKSLHRRAESLKAAAETYNKTRAENGTTEPAISANAIARNAQVAAAKDAFIDATKLVRGAYKGISGYNAAAAYGSFVGERLTAVTTAYRNAVTPWLADLTSVIALDSTNAAIFRGEVHAQLLVDAAVADGGNAALMVGIIDGISAKFGVGGYTDKHAARRDIAWSYETVLRTLVMLSTSTAPLEAHQEHLYTALRANALSAKNITLTPYVAASPTTTVQMGQVIDQLTQRADLAAAVAAAAYGALRSNTPSNTNKTYKAARAQAITEMTGLIQEGAIDFADIVLKEETSVATADLKAKVAHQLGRLYVEKAKAERIRFDNLGVAADKEVAHQSNEKAVDAFKKEIAAILSQTDSSLMANRNARLMEAYEQSAEAYKNAIANGADASLARDQHLATFNYAQIMYRTGEIDRSADILEALVETPDAMVVQGAVLRELAEQYEAAGTFLKSAKVYKAAALQHVARKDAAGAFDAAENALKAARQINHTEACQVAADAFNAIGATVEFHGRVRAEAYAKAAEALIHGELLEDAAVAYDASGDEWSKIGDHMQAGNQHEKAAWALSRVATVSVDQRIEIIQSVEKAAHQLQIAEATDRLVKLVDLAEEQISKIRAVEDSLTAGKLKAAVVSAAGAMYEKALAFQKNGDMSHAQAAEKRILELVKIVDANGKEAEILKHVANLYTLQNNHAEALNTYIKAAESLTEAKRLKAASKAYASAASAAIAAGEGVRITTDILKPLLDISVSVRSGGTNAGHAEQFDVHLAVVELYRDLSKLTPDSIDNALKEIAEIEKESPANKEVIVRLASMKIALLSEKSTTVGDDTDKKIELLTQAKSAFDAIKDLSGETIVETVSVKRYVAEAANSLTNMYALSRVIHTAEASVGLAYLDTFKSVVKAAENVASAAHAAASRVKMSYDIALEASKEAARAMEAYTRAMVYYMATETGKSRTDDMVDLRDMPERMATVVEFSVRETLLGILKSREEAAVMQSNFAEVLDATNKVTSYVAALRKSDVVRDSHGSADKAAELKTSIASTATAVKGAQGDLLTQAAAAQSKPPVERAAATDKIVADKADAIATVVSNGMVTQAKLAKTAPAAAVTNAELATHGESIMTAVLGDGKTDKGIVGSLQKAQSGPSSTAVAIVNNRS